MLFIVAFILVRSVTYCLIIKINTSIFVLTNCFVCQDDLRYSRENYLVKHEVEDRLPCVRLIDR